MSSIVLCRIARWTMRRIEGPKGPRSADVQRKISWRDGLLIFANTDLSEAIDQVMRHSNMKINLKHPALAELTVSGIFNAGDTEEFLSAIHQQLPVEAIRYSSNWVVVRARQ